MIFCFIWHGKRIFIEDNEFSIFENFPQTTSSSVLPQWMLYVSALLRVLLFILQNCDRESLFWFFLVKQQHHECQTLLHLIANKVLAGIGFSCSPSSRAVSFICVMLFMLLLLIRRMSNFTFQEFLLLPWNTTLPKNKIYSGCFLGWRYTAHQGQNMV